MAPIQSDAVISESKRLNSLGIPYQFIVMSDGKPVVIVDPLTMNHVVNLRKSGKSLDGRFVCNVEDKRWSASAMIDGTHVFKDHLTECKAYRTVLGYQIGHYTRNVRYIGQYPYRTRKKARRKHD